MSELTQEEACAIWWKNGWKRLYEEEWTNAMDSMKELQELEERETGGTFEMLAWDIAMISQKKETDAICKRAFKARLRSQRATHRMQNVIGYFGHFPEDYKDYQI